MSNITIFQGYDNPILLGSGSEGWIYRISDNYVVKVAARERYKTDMFYEIKMCRLLYSLGISVPEPIMCDYVRINGAVKKGFIMDYIDGITNSIYGDKTDEFSDYEWNLATTLALDEVKRAKKLGFSLAKNKDGHNIDNPEWIFTKDKKIKLIDFTKWQYKDIICQY
jgi:hypothetical protein